jgi:murein L,D-transpeptidase YafK
MKKILVLVFLIGSFIFSPYGRGFWYSGLIKFTDKKTVTEVIDKLEDKVITELSTLFEAKGIVFPPENLSLIAYKYSKELEVWASNSDKNFKLITRYHIKAASGVLGPKLVEGDKQVPEGIYQIEGFNPNSSYHLSMKLNYPNDFDLLHANNENRTSPGTNIFIHGRSVSIGCLAMGDSVIEKLFVLVHATGLANTSVIISPKNPSLHILQVRPNSPEWVDELYQNIVNQHSKVTGK